MNSIKVEFYATLSECIFQYNAIIIAVNFYNLLTLNLFTNNETLPKIYDAKTLEFV